MSALVVLVVAVGLVVGSLTGTFSLLCGGLGLAAAGVALLVVAVLLDRSRRAAQPEGREPQPAAPPIAAAPEGGASAAGADPMFPIARYDSLWVTQIVPLLTGLTDEELAVVDTHERGGRHRAGVLDAIDAQRRGDELPTEPDVRPDAPLPVASDVPAAPASPIEPSEPADPEASVIAANDVVPTFLGRPAGPLTVHRP